MGLLAPPRNLQRDRLSVPYQERLKVAGEWFARWCARQELDMTALSQNPKLMTGALVTYLQALYDHGFALWLGVHTVLWAQTEFRELKGHLRSAWDSVSSWRLSRPVTSRVPMPEAVMRALVCWGVLSATTMEKRCAHMWWNFSVAVPFAFFGLMRPQELFGLKKEHIRLPGPQSFVQTQVGTATIFSPKNRAFGGRRQVRLVKDRSALAWMAWWLRSLPEGGAVWGYSEYRFRRCLAEGLAYLGLEGLKLSAASLRAGGATCLLERGVSLAEIRFAGCWASEKAMSVYLQEAEAAATLLQISGPAAVRLERVLKLFAFCASPPACEAPLL